MAKKKYKDKYDKLANAPIKQLISSLAIPTILSMLVSALYNTADSFFVGKINTQSVASIGIVFSIMTLLQAIGFFLGNGSGIMISTLLGEKKKEEAQIYAIIGLFFSTPIALMLGATKSTKAYASTYLRYILIGSPFILGSFVLNNHLRYQGSALYSMIGIITGSIINIALDPLFIFTFKLEVAGAALATIISQTISFFILYFGTFKNDNIRISIKRFKPKKDIYFTIFKNGMPSLSRQGISTIANIAMNFACAPFGDAVIAGMSVYNRVMFIGMAVVIGYGQGYQPVCSFNFGAKKYDRVYNGYKFLAKITTVIIIVLSIIGYIFAPQLIAIFRKDVDVIKVGTQALRYQSFAMAVTGFCTASNMLMQSLRISGKATVLALARQGIFYIPAIIILPRLFAQTGIALAQPVADILSFILTIFLVLPTLKKLKAKTKSNI